MASLFARQTVGNRPTAPSFFVPRPLFSSALRLKTLPGLSRTACQPSWPTAVQEGDGHALWHAIYGTVEKLLLFYCRNGKNSTLFSTGSVFRLKKLL